MIEVLKILTFLFAPWLVGALITQSKGHWFLSWVIGLFSIPVISFAVGFLLYALGLV